MEDPWFTLIAMMAYGLIAIAVVFITFIVTAFLVCAKRLHDDIINPNNLEAKAYEEQN